ncbi:MAG: lysozyme inhibitor LprI family protein [Thiotrichaceae bacterium]
MYQYVILPFIIFTVAQAEAASFDCKKASSKLEHTICNDAELNQADTELGTIYRKLLKKLSKSDIKQLQQMQRDWLTTREQQCDVSEANCLTVLYQKRIAALQFRDSEAYATSAAGKLSGIYDGIGNMEMQVIAIAPEQLFIHIQGTEPTSARWICDFEGEAELQDNVIKVKALDDAFVTISFKDATATVDEGQDSMWCGAGGSLNGKYHKNK